MKQWFNVTSKDLFKAKREALRLACSFRGYKSSEEILVLADDFFYWLINGFAKIYKGDEHGRRRT